MLTMRIKQRHRHRGCAVIGHQLDKFARVEVMLYVIGGNLDKAEAGKTAGDIGFGAVDGSAITSASPPAGSRSLSSPPPCHGTDRTPAESHHHDNKKPAGEPAGNARIR